MHNQVRQFNLALEKKWITHNPCFQLYTAIVGMISKNTWKILKKKSYSSNTDFAYILSHDILSLAEKILQ